MTTAPERVRAWMDGRTDKIDRDDVREVYITADRASRDLPGAISELRRALADRDALAARVAELEGELSELLIADGSVDLMDGSGA